LAPHLSSQVGRCALAATYPADHRSDASHRASLDRVCASRRWGGSPGPARPLAAHHRRVRGGGGRRTRRDLHAGAGAGGRARLCRDRRGDRRRPAQRAVGRESTGRTAVPPTS
jgi:hypothetical protein